MLIEKTISLVATGLGFALAGPNAVAILQQHDHEGGVAMLTGDIVGALGIYLGAALASTYSDRKSRAVRMVAWTVVAIVLSLTIGG